MPLKPVLRRTPEVVDPLWLIKAIALVILLAVVCAYLAICALFWQGQWQLVLHPSHTYAHQPSELGLPAEDVWIASPQGRLHGWYLPAPAVEATTVLLLGDGSGTAADNFVEASALHQAGLNVLLFDYSGFGASSGSHPRLSTMQANSEFALSYLTGVRGIPPSHILLFGKRLGASLAVRLSAEHSEIPALILEDADGDLTERARHDQRALIVPFDLLFQEKFPLALPLASLPTPKLLITTEPGPAPRVFMQAASPKMMLELPATDTNDLLLGLQRFLSSYSLTTEGSAQTSH